MLIGLGDKIDMEVRVKMSKVTQHSNLGIWMDKELFTETVNIVLQAFK